MVDISAQEIKIKRSDLIQYEPGLISQSSSYAIFSLTRLNGPEGDYRLVREIAKEANVPPDFLAKIFNVLNRKGIVQARRGVGGGVRLAMPHDKVTVIDVCKALDDPILGNRCFLGLANCSNEAPCPSHEFWSGAKQLIISQLSGVNLKNIEKALTDKGFMNTRFPEK